MRAQTSPTQIRWLIVTLIICIGVLMVLVQEE